ncbi:imidazole glycerol phosphate synthase subunit HisH [Aquirufa antheringensis]|jgi:imidazole glycerol-phosphate synthase subunit HisH|uniref:imidazole glycerol phosphate synthase subunit HisH n=1 Tax=Aquirufa antheringensis TaxID=2516559 RepID=UPI0010329E8C|nr:imidazole glycerol phosphate synthase subunit HisH [Aquirufa antheringensis]MCZ2484767.1 imidazole glycerol phosphate synthase subunit HisH [Aquirufa antheringensis]TBH71719.1 imidazole glycerol phosphate synthase subunit HisH [Aquirufa antheringensis]
MEIAIIKYNAGNVASVMYALDRIGQKYQLTDDHEQIKKADKVIFPGVGEASTAMAYLKEKGLDEVIKGLKQPVLATCIGMQLLCKHSEEGNVDCIGVFDVEVKKFISKDLKIPHVGWNSIVQKGENPLMKGLKEEEFVYFVHSFYAPVNQYTTAVCEYEQPFSAMLHKDNFYAAQFHAEISGKAGEQILKNFLAL